MFASDFNVIDVLEFACVCVYVCVCMCECACVCAEEESNEGGEEKGWEGGIEHHISFFCVT